MPKEVSRRRVSEGPLYLTALEIETGGGAGRSHVFLGSGETWVEAARNAGLL